MLGKRNIKRKLLSILLASTLIAGALPGTAYAELGGANTSSNELTSNQSSNDMNLRGLVETAATGGPIPADGSDVSGGLGLKYFVGFTATSGTGIGNGNTHQGPEKLLDGAYGGDYKYYNSSSTIETEFKAAKAFVPKKYYLMTGEDTASYPRNPKTWKISARENEGDDYTVIANVSGDTKMQDENNTVYEFDFNNAKNKKYRFFKFEVSAIEDNEKGFQLAELFMAGVDNFLVPSDGDDAGDGLKYYVDFTSDRGTEGANGGSFIASPDKLFDHLYGNERYKYCVNQLDSGPLVTTTFHYSKAFVPKKYVLLTAEDNSKCPGRNPKSWKIYASEKGEDNSWDIIADETDNAEMIANDGCDDTPVTFSFNENTNKEYQYFKFEVTAITGDNCFQLGELYMAGKDEAQIVDVDYPYATSTTGDSVKLTVDCDKKGVAYQWQKSEASQTKATSFTNISGATSQEYEFTGNDLVNGAWYRCRVGDSFSKAVQLINPGGSNWGSSTDKYGRIWTYPHRNSGDSKTSWYVSNGKAAYTLDISQYSAKFDTVGEYTKGSTTYMIQTTYAGNGWSMISSSEKNPNPTSSWYATQKKPDKLKVLFDENNSAIMGFEATLNNGGSFSVYSDTQLGNNATSGMYYDSAALIAGLNYKKGIKQLTMVGAASEENAKEEDPAFSVKVDKNPVFWVGSYSLRLYDFNISGRGCTLADVFANGRGNVTGAVKAEGIDSGTALNWLDLDAGTTVKFQFAIGSAKDSGAVSSTVNYEEEKLAELTASETYDILDENGSVKQTVTAGSDGKIDISAYLGQTIFLAHGNDTPEEITLAPRPVALEPIVADQTEIARSPIYVKDQETAITEDSVTLTFADNAMFNQKYAIFNGNNNVSGWVTPNEDGMVIFTGLTENTAYNVRAYIPATDMTPKSLEVSTDVTTAAAITVKEPENTDVNYDGNAHRFAVTTTGGSNTKVDYSTDYAEDYSAAVPSFTEGGRYTVFYRVTADNSVPLYGEFEVTVRPQVQFFANGGTLNDDTPDEAFYVDFGDTINADYFAEPTYSSSTRFFAGWYTSDKFSARWDETTPVRENLTLYARWVQKLFGISGTAVANAISVQLFQGNKAISEKLPLGEDKSFTFNKIPDGEYDLVVSMKDNRTITKLVTLKDSDIRDLDVAAANVNISSIVNVADETPDIVVGNLDKEAADTDTYWNEIYDHTGNRVELALDAAGLYDWTGIDSVGAEHLSIPEKGLWAEETAIVQAADANEDKIIEFIDLYASQAVVKKDADINDADSSAITESKEVLEIIIPYDTDEVEGLTVYRYHDGEAEKLREVESRPTANLTDGVFYVEGADTANSRGGYIALYSDSFSTYAIGYEDPQLPKTKATDPKTPQLLKTTKTSITVVEEPGHEYSIDGGETWQSSGEFTGLEVGKEYSIIARIAETDEKFASDPSEALVVKTNSNDITTNTELVYNDGQIKIEKNVDEGLPSISIGNYNLEFAKSLLTEDERKKVEGGAKLWVYLDVKAIETEVTDDDKNSMDAIAKTVASDGKIGTFIEISLYKKIGTGDPTKVTELGSNKIRLSVEVPESMLAPAGVSRRFFLAQIHNTIARILAISRSRLIETDLDGFSLFAIGYSDKENNYLVAKQKVFAQRYFSSYGQDSAKYKYKLKVENKSHKKIVKVTKDMIKARNTGTAKVSLYRKARKGGSWEKVEEVEFIVEKPVVTKRASAYKAGDTINAMSFVTGNMSVKPTYFQSSKPEVATVDFNTGEIKVLKKGRTTITIAYDNGIGAAKYRTKLVVN